MHTHKKLLNSLQTLDVIKFQEIKLRHTNSHTFAGIQNNPIICSYSGLPVTVNLHSIQVRGKSLHVESKGINRYHKDFLREICRTGNFTVLHPVSRHERITVICETDHHLLKTNHRSTLL